MTHMTSKNETRPWGEFHVLYDGDDCKIKRIIVSPHKRLSLQSHSFRSEDWLVLHGNGKAQLGSIVSPIKTGNSIHIPVNTKHRLINDTDEVLHIIEIQTGSYFGEDDIERFEDDFDRS